MQVSTAVANSRQVNEKATSLRVAGLFVGPLIVGLIELFHPLHFVNGKMVMTNVAPPELGWWIALHIIQIPLFGLVGLAAYLLLADQPGLAATIGKVAVALFTVFYAAFDALSGLGTGLLMQYAVDTPAVQTPAFAQATEDFFNNTIAFYVSEVGALAWVVTMLTVAAIYAHLRVPSWIFAVLGAGTLVYCSFGTNRLFGSLVWWIGIAAIVLIMALTTRQPLLTALLTIAAIFFSTTHEPPYGPLAMLGFLLAVALIKFSGAWSKRQPASNSLPELRPNQFIRVST